MSLGPKLSSASKLISPAYLELQAATHREHAAYGTMGAHFAAKVAGIAEGIKAKTILDYGCGKRFLERGLYQVWKGAPVCHVFAYDPCIPEFAGGRRHCDLVACIDVLEHIEPDYLDAVLDDIRDCTAKVAFFTIANRPAQRTLADGRNAHLTQKPPLWWHQKLVGRFRIQAFQNVDSEDDREFLFICDHPKRH